MDNISHTLVSVLLGEAAHRLIPRSAAGLASETRRRAGIGLMVLGNNLPDADFIYPALTGSRLDYLLEHRGHTHTIIGALLISALMLGAVWLWFRIRHRPCSRGDAIYLALLAVLAPLLHIAMDYTNSYGVHPLWPVDNSWHYGDAVYIVEPLIWACATPLLFTLQSRLLRAAIALILLAGIGLCLATGLVPGGLVVVLVLFILLLGAVGRLTSAGVALASGIAAWLGVTAIFFATAAAANARIALLASRAFPSAHVLDLVLNPLPANPLCREVIIVQTEGDSYVLRTAMHSIAPGWIPASTCPLQVARGQTTAHLAPTAATDNHEIVWRGEIVMPRSQLAALAADYCAVRSLLHFARAPWAARDGLGWIVGDLRFDRGPGPSFAEFRVGPSRDECPTLMPAWLPPRSDLLR